MTLVRLLVAVAVAGGIGLGGLAFRRRTHGASQADAEPIPDAIRPGPADVWTVLGFTSPMCVACHETPGIVAQALGVEPAALEAGAIGPVVFRAVDVREHPGLVEHLDVLRTPTVAVVDPEGRVVYQVDENPDPQALGSHLPQGAREANAASVGRGAALRAAVPRRRETA